MKILVVVDMQNDFISGSLGTREAQEIVANVVKRIERSENELILFTQDTHSENYLDTQEGRNLPVKHCIENTPGWEIHSEIRKAWLNNKNTVVDQTLDNNTLLKNTFGSRALAKYLEETEYGIEEIEFIGLCTDICVISNALLAKAYLPEAKITVNASSCAGVTPESHGTALAAMEMCQINIINK